MDNNGARKNGEFSSARSLLGIIKDILDFAKIEAHKLDIESISFNLFDVLEHAVSMASPKAGEKGLKIIFSVAPGLPRLLTGDPLRLGQVLSRPGLGSTFTFTIRFDQGSESLPTCNTLTLDLREKRVLLVEDNSINQQVAREMLENAGMLAHIAVNGQAALEALSNPDIRYDAVLMDIQMPVMDGYEATRPQG